LGENPEVPGTKAVGILFANPAYPAVVGTGYTGTVRVNNLLIPVDGTIPDDFYWPLNDGNPGSTLTTDGSGGLYWTDPPIPPNLVTDTDATDYFLTPTLTWIDALVSVTATKVSLQPSIGFECTLLATFAAQTVQTRMLVDGVPTGQIFTVELPRNVNWTVHYNWTTPLPLGTETITIEQIHSGTQTAEVLGSVNVTELQLLEP
jgi:hypothetical protein